jgi:hypothetical protein
VRAVISSPTPYLQEQPPAGVSDTPATSGGSSADEILDADNGTFPHNDDAAAAVATPTLDVNFANAAQESVQEPTASDTPPSWHRAF